MKWITEGVVGLLGFALIVAGSACSLPASAPPAGSAKVDVASVAQGGLLYDKWWKVVERASEPKGNHPLWASQSSNKAAGSATWRCKECHGWDYKGKDGAYGKGTRRYTGFPGVWEAAQRKSVAELSAFLGSSANPQHNAFTGFRPVDIADLANFLKHGLVDMAKYVDYATKKPIGANAARGKPSYDTLCAACHGADGKKLNFGDDKKPEYVGTVAKDNPQEFIHKTWVGQPGSEPPMPSALEAGWSIQQVVDVLAYVQTLPAK